ncbi:unnamed protein product [Gongylonema pulchrum]|uniref:ATP-dependent DNA helicase n=1 Tax=Gongylonema pulchrum TaxID=637853 RepID=A0A183CXH2_9BILA|nr:unnamed protein product [Gongylonema pulchrum]
MGDVVGDRNFVIDISTPETLERDFYAWLYGEIKTSSSISERLPPIDDLAFRVRDSLLSPDEMSDGGSFADSPPSSISSDSNDYRGLADAENRHDFIASCPGRSSGENFRF